MSDPRLCSHCGIPLMRGHDVCPACTARLALASGPLEDDDDEENESVGGEVPQRIGGYDLGEELGRGAMGVVFRARDRRLGRPVALKVVLAGRFASAAERQRFVLEAEAAARLEHPHIVTVYESGEAEGRPFFSMRLVEGTTLADRLRRGPLVVAEAVALLRSVALAVQHAHERGVLHRDLKPGNVLLDAAGRPHVADFGLARQLDREATLTVAGSPLGTPGYMAPEAADGTFSAASDVWSMGVMLYEVLAGRPPFAESSLTGLLLAVREQEPPPLRPRVAGVDRDLESVCLRCLEKSPSRRYRSAAAMAEDLERWAHGVPVQARPVTSGERLVKWVRRRPGVAALSLTALLLLAVGATGVLWQWRRANQEADAARAALRQSEESLWQANAARARALVSSRAPGQRTEALAALRAAAAHRPERELRDLAIAALALPDLALEPETASSIELPLGGAVRAVNGDLSRVAWKSGDELVVAATADGAEWARLKLAGLEEYGISANSDLSRIALVGGDGVHVFSLPDGTRLFARSGVRSAALDPSGGTLFSVTGDGAIEVHALPDGRRLGGGSWAGRATGMVADAAGQRVAVWRDTRLAVLAAPDMRVVADYENLPSAIMGAAFNPDDGTLLAGLDSSGLAHFDPAIKSAQLVARHDREGVSPLAHPGGLLAASTAWDSTTRLSALGWDELLVVHGLRPLAFSADGKRLLALRDRRLRLANLTLPDIWRPLTLGQLEPRGVAFSPDGTRLAVAYRTALAVWDVATGRPLARLPLADAQQVAWHADGSLWVALNAEGLGRFTFDPGPPAELRGPEILIDGARGHIASFVTLPGNRVATNGGRLIVWQWPDRTEVRELEANPFSDILRVSPDGRFVAAGCWANNGRPGSFVGIWSPDQVAPLHRLPAGNADVFFAPDGRSCLVGEISGYREYDTTTWKSGRTWPRPSSGLGAARAAWTADGSLLCLHADETALRLLDPRSGQELARLASPIIRRAERFDFSADGRWLAVVSTRSLQIWDLPLLRARLKSLGLEWSP